MRVWCLLLICAASWVGASEGAAGSAINVRRANHLEPVWDSEGFNIGGGQFSVWRPSTVIQGFYPLGDRLGESAGVKPHAGKSLLVFDGNDGKVAPPVAVVVDTSYGNTKKKLKAGFTIYQLLGPPGYECLGFVARSGHQSVRNWTVEEFQNYRCVDERYVVKARSVDKFLSIVDHYDPSESYGRTVLWTVNCVSGSAYDLPCETFISAGRDGKKPPSAAALKTAALTFTNPMIRPEAPLLAYETSQLDLIGGRKDSNPVWSVRQCCSLGHSAMPQALQVAANPRQDKHSSSSSSSVAPLAKPTGFAAAGQRAGLAFVRPVCPSDYEALGDFLELDRSQLMKYARCVHRSYVSRGRWAPFAGYFKAEPVDEAASLGVSTLFVDRINATGAPLLRRSATSVQSGLDVVKIIVANSEDIWKNLKSVRSNPFDPITISSASCSAPQSAAKFIIDSSQSLSTLIQITIKHPVESPFQVDIPTIGIFDQVPAPNNPLKSFVSRQLSVSHRQLAIKQTTEPGEALEYQLRKAKQSLGSNWTVKAHVHRVDGTRQTLDLEGSAVKVTYANVSAHVVPATCGSSAPSSSWLIPVVLLIVHLYNFI